jgi:hypothetical protein
MYSNPYIDWFNSDEGGNMRVAAGTIYRGATILHTLKDRKIKKKDTK